MLDTRIDLPSAAGIQDVFRHLANDLSRTEAIAAEIESAIGQGRKVLVLTERTEHLDAILKALTDKQLSPFMLHGHPALLRMRDRRQRGYRAMGHKIGN